LPLRVRTFRRSRASGVSSTMCFFKGMFLPPPARQGQFAMASQITVVVY
jgi:hypothetical protein